MFISKGNKFSKDSIVLDFFWFFFKNWCVRKSLHQIERIFRTDKTFSTTVFGSSLWKLTYFNFKMKSIILFIWGSGDTWGMELKISKSVQRSLWRTHIEAFKHNCINYQPPCNHDQATIIRYPKKIDIIWAKNYSVELFYIDNFLFSRKSLPLVAHFF